jgi:hypothetical protein
MKENEQNEPIRKCIIFIKVRNKCWERVESKKNNGMKIVDN